MKKSIPGTFIIVCLLFIIALSGILYRSSFTAYFFQDDWFTLAISRANSITDFVNFFVPRTDVIYYRPLGMQVPFFILQSLFGINPTAFHILTFLTHAANIILVFLLVNLLAKNKFVAVLTSFFYGTSTVHYIPFFWPSTYPFVLGPLMFLLSFIFFLLFLKKRRNNIYIISVILFFSGLLTNEMVAVLPIVLFFYLFLLKKKKFVKFVLPYFIIAGLLFLLRFTFFPLPTTGVYQISINRSILSNLKAYFLWSFNWPEETKAQFVNFYTINPQFIRDFFNYFIIFIVSFVVSCFSFYILPGMLILTKYITADKRLFLLVLFGFLWFVSGLLPVILFPKHAFSYYLPISLVGLLLVSTSLIANVYVATWQKKKVRLVMSLLLVIVCINWLWVSSITIDFNAKVHWAPRRAQIASELTDKAKRIYSKTVKEPFIYVSATDENKLALNNQDALKVLFGQDDVVTIYTKDRQKAL